MDKIISRNSFLLLLIFLINILSAAVIEDDYEVYNLMDVYEIGFNQSPEQYALIVASSWKILNRLRWKKKFCHALLLLVFIKTKFKSWEISVSLFFSAFFLTLAFAVLIIKYAKIESWQSDQSTWKKTKQENKIISNLSYSLIRPNVDLLLFDEVFQWFCGGGEWKSWLKVWRGLEWLGSDAVWWFEM